MHVFSGYRKGEIALGRKLYLKRIFYKNIQQGVTLTVCLANVIQN